MLHKIVNSIARQTSRAAGYVPLPSISSLPSSPLSLYNDAASSHFPIERPQSPHDLKWTDEKFMPTLQGNARRYLCLLNPVPIFLALIPSFLQSNGPESPPERRLSSTAWLDGLRGLAALIVVFHHSSLLFFQWNLHDGPNSAANNHHIIQWPFIRLLISGFPCVCIFFVVSGYALSYRPLTLLSTNQHSAFYSSLSSSIFRRHPRLFLPATVASLFSAVLCVMGLYGTDEQVLPNVAQPFRSPPRMDNIALQLENWAYHALKLADPMEYPISGGVVPEYDPNLWTIPSEFKSSLIVFLLLAATARFTPRTRLVLFWVVLAWAFWSTHFAPFLFVSGMVLAEMRVHKEVAASPGQGIIAAAEPQKSTGFLMRHPTFAHALAITSFLACLYILGTPEWVLGFPSSGFGYGTLATWIPKRYHDAQRGDAFFPIIGSFFLVLVVDRTPLLQRLFTCQFSQYMGRISFSLYLVHGPILYTAARPLAVGLTKKFGQESLMGYGAGVALTIALVAPLLVITADAGYRFVDLKAVSISRAAYKRLTGS